MMKPNSFAAVQAQPATIKTLELAIPESSSFQRVQFILDMSATGNPAAFLMTLDGVPGFGTAKRVIVDARYCPLDLVFSIADSMGDTVMVPAGSRMRFSLPGVPAENYSIYAAEALNSQIGVVTGYVKVYFDNAVGLDESSDNIIDSTRFLYTGSITAAGVATPIVVTDNSGVNGLPMIDQWGYIAPGATSTAASELDVQLTLAGQIGIGVNILPLLSSNIGAAAGGGTDGLVVSPKSRTIWMPGTNLTPASEGVAKVYSATPSFPFGTAAGFAAPHNVIIYLWCNKSLR